MQLLARECLIDFIYLRCKRYSLIAVYSLQIFYLLLLTKSSEMGVILHLAHKNRP